MTKQMSVREKAASILSGSKLRMLEDEGLMVVENRAPYDFVTKAYDMVNDGSLEFLQAIYRGDGVVVIVRKATEEERHEFD